MTRLTGIQVLAIVLVVNGTGSVSTAQDCASFQSSGGQGRYEGSCSGDPEGTAFFTGTGTASLTIQCDFNSWRSTEGPSEQITVTATHACGLAGPGEEPACQDIIVGPINRGWDRNAGNVQVEMYGAHAGWDGENCTFEGYANEFKYLPHDGCTNAFCCGLQTECTAIGEFSSDCKCALSPIVINLDGQGVQLTDRARGVNFDLNRDGRRERLPWTRGDREDAWLVLDRNENGQIDDGGELFGSVTDQPAIDRPNGFNALSVFDDNRDGMIDRTDSSFRKLRLWVDRDQDGWSAPEELYPLEAKGVPGLSLDYRESRREDRFGNIFRYWAPVQRDRGMRRTWAVDVFLVGVSESEGRGASTSCRTSSAPVDK